MKKPPNQTKHTKNLHEWKDVTVKSPPSVATGDAEDGWKGWNAAFLFRSQRAWQRKTGVLFLTRPI